jgi:hypothetical protein
MKVSHECGPEQIAATKQKAHSLFEDLQHIRELLAKEEPSSGDIRRLSVPLRRMLIHRELQAVAAPRVGKITILAHDNNPVYRAERQRPILFYMTGHNTPIIAWDISIQLRRRFGRQETIPEVSSPEYTELRLDTFLSQRVLCYRTNWLSRAAVIKYVANYRGGAHSGPPITRDETLLAQMSNSCSLIRKEDGSYLIDLFRHGIDNDISEFRKSPGGLDPLLIETFASAVYLVKSPKILELEALLRAELS